MMPEKNNVFNGDNNPLRSGENGNDDRLQDASNSDAAAENARESEQIQEASRAATTSFQLGTDEGEDKAKRDVNNEEPPTTQGSEEEIEENLSGTTNLTIEQLKKEGDPGGFTDESEQMDNP